VAYCEQCGWNLSVASSRIQTDVRAAWIVSAFGLVLVLLAGRGPLGISGTFGIAVAFLLLPSSLALMGHYRLSRIKRIANGPARTADPPAIGPTQSNFELDRFCLMPRPRQVKMSWLGRLYAVGVGGATVLGMWLLSIMVRALLHPRPGATLKLVLGVVVYCVWCWVCFTFFRNRVRERDLFVNGDFAKGRVAARTNGSQGTYIVYTFQSVSGGAFQNRVLDFSKNQFEQMSVHVFYDPLDPSRSAALEASVYRAG